MQINLDINDTKIDDFKDAFLKVHPKEDPEMSDSQWMKFVLKRWLLDIYCKGKRRLHDKTYVEPSTEDLIN